MYYQREFQELRILKNIFVLAVFYHCITIINLLNVSDKCDCVQKVWQHLQCLFFFNPSAHSSFLLLLGNTQTDT